MNPLRRSELRDGLRADADRWTALAERHGTPLLVLRPHLATRRYRVLAERLSGFRLHYAVKALPHPIVLTTIALCGGGFDVATSAEVDTALARPADGPLHSHQSDREAPPTSTMPMRQASAHLSSRTLARQRNSRVGPTTSGCWSVGVPQSDSEIGPVVEIPASSRPTPNCSSNTSCRRRTVSPTSAPIGSQARRRGPGCCALPRTHCAYRGEPRRARPSDRHRWRVSRRLPRVDADNRFDRRRDR